MTTSTSMDPTMREIPLSPDGEVEIVLTSNRLRLRGADGDRVVIRARGGEDLDDAVTIESGPGHVRIRDGGVGELRLGPLRISSRHGTDLEVEVPRTARVSVRSLSGDVEAIGLGGSSRWATSSGDLRLQLDGGPVTIESMSGDVTLDATVAVSVNARTVSGDLRVRAPRLTGINATTTSGDVGIEAAFDEGAAHSISSISGDIRLATASAVRLEAQSVTGDVGASIAHRAEGRRGSRTLVVGVGDVRVSVRTMSGDVSLRPAGAAADLRGSPRPPTPHAAPPAPAAPAAPAAPPLPVEAGAVGGAEAGDPLVVVAEASAAPNLLRPATDPADSVATDPDVGDVGSADRRDTARLEVLRALERGDLDIEAASRRLEALEQAGPRSFRGWC